MTLLYSTKQAAEKVGISYITLRRWLADRAFCPTGQISIGGSRTLWRFSDKDIDRLIQHKKRHYREGRGRIPRGQDTSKRQRNDWVREKRFLSGLPQSVERIQRAKVERRIKRQAIARFRKAVAALRSAGLKLFCPDCKATVSLKIS